MDKESMPIIKIGDEVTLDAVEIGTSGTIAKVNGEGKIRHRLFDMGLTPGASVFVRKRAPLGDPLEITLRGYELSLRHSEASFVLIKVTDLPEEKKGESK